MPTIVPIPPDGLDPESAADLAFALHKLAESKRNE